MPSLWVFDCGSLTQEMNMSWKTTMRLVRTFFTVQILHSASFWSMKNWFCTNVLQKFRLYIGLALLGHMLKLFTSVVFSSSV